MVRRLERFEGSNLTLRQSRKKELSRRDNITAVKDGNITRFPPCRVAFLRAKGLKNSHFYALIVRAKENDKPGFVEMLRDLEL